MAPGPDDVLWLLPDRQLRTRNAGHTLIAHHPVGVLRLGAAGAPLVRDWFSGSPVSANVSHQALARRLVSGGYAHWRLDSSGNSLNHRKDVSVVIPVKDDLDGLRLTLNDLLQDSGSLGRIIVVDDGSHQPIDLGGLELASAGATPIALLRSPVSEGPAAARNLGLSAVTTTLVAFVDAGVTVAPSQLGQLAALTRCSDAVAAAPRVAASPTVGLISAYERTASPLDMGPHPSVVAPGRPVTYVPSACLVVQTRKILEVGGFDRSLRFGEDVDLIWRLASHGTVLYRPEIVVQHPPRSTLADFTSQRFSYGTSVGPLAARHGSKSLAPVVLAPWLVAAGAVAMVARRRSAAILGLAAIGRLRWLANRLQQLDDPEAEAAVLLGREIVGQLNGILSTSRRPWSPVLIALAVFGGQTTGRAARVLLTTGWLQSFAQRGGLVWRAFGLTLADDLAYSLGVLSASIRAGQPAPLVPKIRRGTDRAADHY